MAAVTPAASQADFFKMSTSDGAACYVPAVVRHGCKKPDHAHSVSDCVGGRGYHVRCVSDPAPWTRPVVPSAGAGWGNRVTSTHCYDCGKELDAKGAGVDLGEHSRRAVVATEAARAFVMSSAPVGGLAGVSGGSLRVGGVSPADPCALVGVLPGSPSGLWCWACKVEAYLSNVRPYAGEDDARRVHSPCGSLLKPKGDR